MSRGAGNYRRFNADEKAQMLRLRAEGRSFAEIGKLTGNSTRRVRDWFRKARDAGAARMKPAADGRLKHGPLPPVPGSSFIRGLTLAQLMGRR